LRIRSFLFDEPENTTARPQQTGGEQKENHHAGELAPDAEVNVHCGELNMKRLATESGF